MESQKQIYRLGDVVRIKSGPFSNFKGTIEGINQSKSLLKVKLDIFGRTDAIKVDFSAAEKLDPPPPPLSTDN
jgi:transcription termination/antitermination protein NusG